MSDSDKPVWPSPPLGFLPFALPGFAAPAEASPSPMTSGLDAFSAMWKQLPGSSQVPGFMVPTTDVAELDKRLSDLRAAEKWVEVNLNMLRATIQGLEVQRNTIAALRSLSAMPEMPAMPPAAAPVVSPPVPPAPSPKAEPAVPATLAATDWLAQLQAQFTRVAEAALAPTKTSSKPAGKRARTPAKKRSGSSKP
jgi:hypothetical protein